MLLNDSLSRDLRQSKNDGRIAENGIRPEFGGGVLDEMKVGFGHLDVDLDGLLPGMMSVSHDRLSSGDFG